MLFFTNGNFKIVSTIQLNKGVSIYPHLSIHPTIVCYTQKKRKILSIEYKMKDRIYIKIESIDNLFFHTFIFPIFAFNIYQKSIIIKEKHKKLFSFNDLIKTKKKILFLSFIVLFLF